jgi:heme-degrading monooxygenase HmoA
MRSSGGEVDMITAITQIEVKPGTEKDFEAAVAKAAALAPAKGHHGFELHRSKKEAAPLSRDR